jgi:outer membrane protein TolC
MKTSTLLFLTLTSTVSIFAEQMPRENRDTLARLSLSEVTSVVLERNPAIQQALRKWQAARQRIPQAAAWDDLTVKGDSRVARFVDVPPQSFTDQMVSIEQAVPITGKNLTRARIATADVVTAWEKARREQLDILLKARSSFFRLANEQAQLTLNRRNLTSLRQLAEVSRSRYEVGKANAADALAAELEASKLQEFEADIVRNISTEQSQLNVLMNRDAFAPLGQPQETILPAADVPMERARARMLANRPEIKMGQARIAAAKSQLDLARRSWIPDPALTVQAQRYNDSAKAASELDAGVSFTVPWVNPSKYSAAVREARENVVAEQQAFEQTCAESLGMLRDALQKVHTAKHHVELFRDKLVPQARQAFEANQFGYESGKATFLEWITAQRNLRDVEAMAQQHIADYQAALAELEAVVGADLNIFPSIKRTEQK